MKRTFLITSLLLLINISFGQQRFTATINGGSPATWYLLAALPASTPSTGDFLKIILDGGNAESYKKFSAQIHLGNRQGFTGYITDAEGYYLQVGAAIECYAQSDGSVNVYLKMNNDGYYGAGVSLYGSSWAVGPTIYTTVTSTNATPVGTIVFNSLTVMPTINIHESGNVGIGTTDPQTKLNILSGGQAAVRLEGNDPYIYSGLQFIDNGQNVSGKVKQWAIWAGRDGGAWASGMGFHRYDAVNPCSGGSICDVSLFLHDNGNVGIGTTAPTDKLSVNGNIRSKKIVVTQQGWPDYVFDSSYTLAPLAQVEQFIKDNKHLPDVPSAKEVTDKGLDVGENQAVLLKKIEELTLYMIEMKKKQESLEKKNEEQSAKISQQQQQIDALKKVK
ncbi:hypothetical protein ACI6Q2_08750 [Chitinophagaceae bacterium LWZ2-11]